MLLPVSSFATGIAANTESADCTESVLNTTNGTSNLEANWQANTLYLSWSVDGQPYATNDSNAASCTYDQGITIPTNPTKTGYTFAGWKVKLPFDLSTLLSEYGNIRGSNHSYTKMNGEVVGDEEKYGLTPGSGEWATEFSYGTVKGEGRCSTQSGTNGWYTNGVLDYNGDWNNTTMLSDLIDETGQFGAKYCWCKPTGFDAEKDGRYESVGVSRWVFYQDAANPAGCAAYCANACGDYVQNYANFRAALFLAGQ